MASYELLTQPIFKFEPSVYPHEIMGNRRFLRFRYRYHGVLERKQQNNCYRVIINGECVEEEKDSILKFQLVYTCLVM